VAGEEPVALGDGLGGCYVFRSASGRSVAVVKPTDEEPLAPNNPKGFVGRQLGDPGLKPTVRVGEAGLREAAAYLLDHGGFAKVPCTSLARMAHPAFNYAATDHSAPEAKLVSIQTYVQHQWDASDVGTAMFPVEAVHRIGILDLRLMNTDRHSGNILVCKTEEVVEVANDGNAEVKTYSLPTVDLVPIDHGFCLPETLETVYFEWLHWPQSSMPFSDRELEYIESLDVKADVALLNRELPMLRVQSLRVLEVSTTLLKLCARAGLTMAEIGQVMSRPLAGFDDEPSELERLCILAKEEVVFNQSINQTPRRLSAREGVEEDADYYEDSDMEDSMFEMDDILSPAPISSSPSRTSSGFAPDSPLGKASKAADFASCLGELSPVSPLKPLRLVREAHGTQTSTPGAAGDPPATRQGGKGSGTSTPRSPRVAITRRHSSMVGGYQEPIGGGGASPLIQYPGAMSVCAAHTLGGADLMRASKPVNCDMPSRELQGLFCDMDQEAWQLFCKILFAEVERSLNQELWKAPEGRRARAVTLGTSAPV